MMRRLMRREYHESYVRYVQPMFRSALRTLSTGRMRMLSKSPSSSRPCKSVALPTWANLPHRTMISFGRDDAEATKKSTNRKAAYACLNSEPYEFHFKGCQNQENRAGFECTILHLTFQQRGICTVGCWRDPRHHVLRAGMLYPWHMVETWRLRQKWQTDQEHEQIWGVGEKGWEGMRRASVPSGKLTINEDLQQLGSVNSSKLSRDSEICEQRQQRSRVKESFKLMNKRWNMMELFRSRRL